VPPAQLETHQARLSSLSPLPGKALVENDPKGAEYRDWPTHLYTNIQRTLSGHEPCICVHPPIRQNVRQNAATSAGPDKRGQEKPPRTDKTSTRFSERERDYSDSKITTSTVQIIHIEIPKLTAQVFLSFVMFLSYFPLPLSSSAGTYCSLRKRTGREKQSP